MVLHDEWHRKNLVLAKMVCTVDEKITAETLLRQKVLTKLPGESFEVKLDAEKVEQCAISRNYNFSR